ncbi:hypothetical protein CBM2586_B10221 [Cupriavidus phytorum]|uniref:Uncharacterized protein n=1 Tax=Cupriavidus taiwanensis TaxID=164546 RepID=A0A375C959_9BURK|nr:hypothetical protein CBM2586_B10221 [Cupriavidus taiwanensis]
MEFNHRFKVQTMLYKSVSNAYTGLHESN